MINQVEKNTTKIQEVSLPLGLAIASMSPAVLTQLGLPLIQQIARFASSKVISPAVDAVQTIEDLLNDNFLTTDTFLSEIPFWKFIKLIHAAIENNLEESLVARGIFLEKDEDSSAYLARVLKDHAEIIIDLITAVAEAQTKNNLDAAKSFHLFQSSKEVNLTLKLFSAIDPIVLGKLLSTELDKHGYSDFCQVIPTSFKGNPGFIINRGSRNQKRLTVGKKQKALHVHDGHDVKTDMIFFDQNTNTLWVNCTRGDHDIYAEAIGALMSDKVLFAVKRNFNLSVFLEHNLIGRLNDAVAGERAVLKIEVRNLKVKTEYGVTANVPAGRYGPCLTTKFSQIHELQKASEVLGVKLKLILSQDGKESTNLEITTNSLSVGTFLHLEDLMACLSDMEICGAYVHS